MPEKQISKAQLRNLGQYKNLTEDEFEELWLKRVTGAAPIQEFEKRIEAKINEFAQDYDLDDLKINDKAVLRLLAQTLIQVDDLELEAFRIRTDKDIDVITKMSNLDKINNITSDLIKSISSMQADLDITRKHRKGDKELTIISELERLRSKAKEFYEAKMFYIFCDKCNMLLATCWFLWPNEKGNRIKLVCDRKLDSGETCGNTVTVSSRDLLEKRGVNIPEAVPDSFR